MTTERVRGFVARRPAAEIAWPSAEGALSGHLACRHCSSQRPLRHGLAATALVVVVCVAVAVVSAADRIDAALVAALVLVFGGWLALSRVRLFRRPGRMLRVRRVRIQHGLMIRSWLETEDTPRRWIPVYFAPELVTLPTPSVVRVHGDPWTDRLVAAEVDGVRLYPSGQVVATQPRGRRGDNPARPDEHAVVRATGAARQLRVDAALLIPAPFVGAFWTFLDGTGFPGWLTATAVAAAVGLWWAAIRGSDPTGGK